MFQLRMFSTVFSPRCFLTPSSELSAAEHRWRTGHSRQRRQKATPLAISLLAGSLLSCRASVVLEDQNQFCASWAENGECARNPTYMMKKCPASCNTSVQNVADRQSIATTFEDRQDAQETPMTTATMTTSTSTTSVTTIGVATATAVPSSTSGPTAEQLKELYINCKADLDQRVTDARKASFDELISNHEEEITNELIHQERQFKDKLDVVTRQAKKTELLLKAQLDMAQQRAEKAEERLRYISSGEETQDAIARASVLADALQVEEQTRLSLELEIQEKLRDIGAREDAVLSREQAVSSQMQATLDRARVAESEAARLRKRQRRLLLKRGEGVCDVRSEQVQCQRRTSVKRNHDAALSGMERNHLRESGVEAHNHDAALFGMERNSLRESVVEGMQILSPIQDSAILRMHAELCMAQARQAKVQDVAREPCKASRAVNFTAWMAAFAWIALWRCVWVLSVRYLLNCCGKLVALFVRGWDEFSDWFCGFDRVDKLAVQDF